MRLHLTLSKVPVLGSVLTLPRSAVREATIDMVLSIIFSTLPIWLGIVLVIANATWASPDPVGVQTWLNSLYSQLDRGEMLMYVAALMGPTLYLASRHLRQHVDPYPWTGLQVVVCVILNLTGTGLFIHGRISGYVDSPGFIHTTIVFYIIALLLLFPAKAHANAQGPDIEKSQQKSEKDFQTQYRKYRSRRD